MADMLEKETVVLNEIIETIKKEKNIVILPHISADGDALGSALALALVLNYLNKNPIVYLEEDVPQIYNFLPGRFMVEVYPKQVKIPDLVIAVDTGDLERLGKRQELFKKAGATINIDHHPTNTEFASLNYINTGSSATGEIIYKIIKMLDLELNKDISTCLYVALITDTGGFRYENTTHITHLIASDLINKGVNVSGIFSRIFDSISQEKTKLMGAAIESLELLEGGRIALITITEEIMRETGALEEESEGIINLGRNIYDVEIAALFVEKGDKIKVSFRSNTDIDVSVIANKYSGGGHKRAAGCLVEGRLKEIKSEISKDLVDVLD